MKHIYHHILIFRQAKETYFCVIFLNAEDFCEWREVISSDAELKF